MAAPRSDASYATHFALLNKAVASKGFKTQPMPYGAAVHLRQRCYMARTKESKINQRIYPETHPLHGRTRWDSVVISIDPPKRPAGPDPMACLVFVNGEIHDETELKLFDLSGNPLT